ncbi:MAG: DUF134 domain-containing protein [Spirochaetaceae bacterium]|nr:DUF134 domain-containing protein [Spirochaetaceae bacterium]
MARPVCTRFIEARFPCLRFGPLQHEEVSQDAPAITLLADEAEALRLADLEGMYQEAAAARMGISRQTFGRIVTSARRKVAEAILQGKPLHINTSCHVDQTAGSPGAERILAALAMDGTCISSHFGRSERFALYEIGPDGATACGEIPASSAEGPLGSIAAELARSGVRMLATGAIGMPALRKLQAYGIEVRLTAAQTADEALQALGCQLAANLPEGRTEAEEKHMKIAIVSDDGTTISRHFGRATHYVVVTLEQGTVVSRELRDKAGHQHFAGNHEHHHDHGAHGFDHHAQDRHAMMALAIKDCHAVVVGGMGAGAYYAMQSAGIRPIVTELSTVDEVIAAYLAGTLKDHPEYLH